MFESSLRVSQVKQDKDFSSLAFLFPGQGQILPQSYVKLFAIDKIKETFDEANRLASQVGLPPVAGLAFNDGQSLDNPLLKNLFQLTMSIALFRYFVSLGKVPKVLTAHSFGEFAALHCTGVISFKEAFDLVRVREECSPEQDELGNLVALSCGLARFNELEITQKHYLANINSPTQIVLAVPRNTVKGLIKTLRSKRIATAELKEVGRPYHCELLSPHGKALANKVRALDIQPQPMRHHFISSVGAQFFEVGHQMTQEELAQHIADQLVQPVYFVDQLATLKRLSIFGYLELASRPVLTGFVRKTLNEETEFYATTAIEFLGNTDTKVSERKQSFKIKDSHLFKKVSGFVSKVTGYSIEEISINQRFEDDLRIDSIKKAEILFHVLEDSQLQTEVNLELSKLKYIGDLVEYVDKRKKEGNKTVVQETSQFQLVEENWIHSRPFTGGPLKSSVQNLSLDELIKGEVLRSPVVFLELPREPLHDPIAVANSLQQFILQKCDQGKLTMLILFGKEFSSSLTGLRSFLLSLRRETHPFKLKVIVSDSPLTAEQVTQESLTLEETDISYKNGLRHSLALKPVEEATIAPGLFDGLNILTIGGSSGILKHFLSQSSMLKNAKLVFVGRSEAEKPRVVEALKMHKKNLAQASYRSCDITNSAAVAQLRSELQQINFWPDLIIDSSGVEVSKLFAEKTQEEKENEFLLKTQGIANIIATFAGESADPSPKILQFNSITSSYGNGGQTIYGFADGWTLPQEVSHLVWPAIYKMGMTENLGILQKLLSQGADLLPQNQVIPSLHQALSLVLSSESPVTVNLVSAKGRSLLRMLQFDYDWVGENMGEVTLSPHFHLESTLDPQTQLFLKDHIISGKQIAPGCIGLANMYLFAKTYLSSDPKVENFRLKSLIPLENGPADIRLEAKFDSVEKLNLGIKTRVENYSGTFTVANIKPTQNFAADCEMVYDVVMDDFYSSKYIPYGPAFCLLDRVQISSDGHCFSVCHFKGRTSYSSNFSQDVMAKIAECVFQTAGFLATWDDFVSLVPTGIGTIEHYDALLTDQLVFASSTCEILQNPVRWMTHVNVYNSYGQLVLRFDSVEGMKIKQHPKFPMNYANISREKDQWITTSLS